MKIGNVMGDAGVNWKELVTNVTIWAAVRVDFLTSDE